MALIFVLLVAVAGGVAALAASAVGNALAHWLGAPRAWTAAGILADLHLVRSTLRSANGADARAVARLFAVAYAAPLAVAAPALAFFLWRAIGR